MSEPTIHEVFKELTRLVTGCILSHLVKLLRRGDPSNQ